MVPSAEYTGNFCQHEKFGTDPLVWDHMGRYTTTILSVTLVELSLLERDNVQLPLTTENHRVLRVNVQPTTQGARHHEGQLLSVDLLARTIMFASPKNC